MNRVHRLWVWIPVTLADVSALTIARPDWRSFADAVGHLRPWIASRGTDAAAASLAGPMLWCVAAWLALALMAAVAAELPGGIGRLAASVSTRVTPGVLRRLVTGAVGTSIVLTPVSAVVASASSMPIPTRAVPVIVRSSDQPSQQLDPPIPWPTDDAPGQSARTGPPPAGSATPGQSVGTLQPPAGSAQSAGTLPPPARSATPRRRTGAGTGAGASITVAVGDSLWLIAAHRLGPRASDDQIADEWPRWYAENRAEIGTDPNIIRPGITLTAPPSSR